MTKPPVVFFAFANNRAVEKDFLRNLAEEVRRVREALNKARREGRCEVLVRENVTADEVWKVFLDDEFSGRIAVFHFAGHAGGKEILLETREGAAAEVHATGLAGFLGLQKGLEVVFLNGCSTRPQVQALLAAGVPAVVATSRAIDDKMATEFSARFYQSLAVEAPLGAAFEQAANIVRSEVGGQRDRACRSFAPQPVAEAADWPWGLYCEDRLRGWKLSGAAGSATVRRAAADIPDLLPYLCDRSDQEGRLDTAVAAHRSQLPRRPLAILIHGDYRQALDRFVERLLDPTLPRFLGRAPLVRKGPLSFKDPGGGSLEERLGPLRRNLAEKLCGDRNAGLEAMANAVVACKSPVMIDVVFALEEDQPQLGPELLSAWLGDLARWPDLPEGQDLLFLLRFGYRETAAPSRLQFWKKSPSRRVAELLAQVMARPPAGLGMAELPPLASIAEGDVRLWIEEYAQGFACQVSGAERDSLICDRLKEKALELFRASPSLPMEELAPKLRSQLLECLQQGGV
jgi:hypothetical protein